MKTEEELHYSFSCLHLLSMNLLMLVLTHLQLYVYLH